MKSKEYVLHTRRKDIAQGDITVDMSILVQQQEIHHFQDLGGTSLHQKYDLELVHCPPGGIMVIFTKVVYALCTYINI